MSICCDKNVSKCNTCHQRGSQRQTASDPFTIACSTGTATNNGLENANAIYSQEMTDHINCRPRASLGWFKTPAQISLVSGRCAGSKRNNDLG